jgi:hypothetical protein
MNDKRVVTLTGVRIYTAKKKKKNRGDNKYVEGVANGL